MPAPMTLTTIAVVDEDERFVEWLNREIACRPELRASLKRCDAQAIARHLHDARALILDPRSAITPHGVRALMAGREDLRVVVLTREPDSDSCQAYLSAGANVYASKDASASALMGVVLTGLSGGVTVWPAELLRGAAAPRRMPASDVPALTLRQVQVMEMLCAGRTDREIGEVLGISRRTVEGHVLEILTKWRCRNRLEAVFHFAGCR